MHTEHYIFTASVGEVPSVQIPSTSIAENERRRVRDRDVERRLKASEVYAELGAAIEELSAQKAAIATAYAKEFDAICPPQ